MLRKSDNREDFEEETKELVAKEEKHEIVVGFPQTIHLYRSSSDSDLKRIVQEETYEFCDFVQVGTEILMRFKFRDSKQAPQCSK